MASWLEIGQDFEAAKVEVIGAMLYPRDDRLRYAYALRNAWARRTGSDASVTATAGEVQELLDLPSRRELQIEAENGIKVGTVAGDLLALIYEQWRQKLPEPSMRAALLHYPKWSIGKKYGDGEALKYSDMQLRRYFQEATPAAHLWAGYRLLKNIKDDGEACRAAFEPQGLPLLLGVARSVQDFAESFIPKRTKPAKPIVPGDEMHRVPEHIGPIELDFRPL
jgi:hypothetical protein